MSLEKLTVSMRTSALEALNEVLYGSEHGLGERTLPLEMKSRTSRSLIKLPLTCRYKDNRSTLLFDKVTRSIWDMLCGHVDDEGIIKIVLDDGTVSYDARLSLPGKRPLEEKRTEVSLQWQEYEEAKYVLRQGLEWMKEKLA
jgi:hypothetical protein